MIRIEPEPSSIMNALTVGPDRAKVTINRKKYGVHLAVACLLRNMDSRNLKLLEALRWCSGSADFQPGGKARRGWNRMCKPLLK